jgi:CRP/FNR family transcriptional regulator, anaerobic regulatory protein
MTISLAYDLRAEFAPLNDAPIRVLRDELLFRRGQPKTHLYQIEAGTIAVYETRADGSHSVVEFAFAGDAVGFGFLESHIHTAQAVGEARVRCLPLSALDQIVQHDKRALQRYAEAMEREFKSRRGELTSVDRKPVNRVAALFTTLSRRNEEEGRDPRIIGDSLDCGTVAGYLGLDVDTLGRALVALERAKIVERFPPNGLRLADLPRLEQLADEVMQ